MRMIAAAMLCLSTGLLGPQAIAGVIHGDRIESVLPIAPGSDTYRATFWIVDGTTPISVLNTSVRVQGATIDLVAHAHIGAFSVGGATRGAALLGHLPPGNYTLRLLTARRFDFGGGFSPEELQDAEPFTVAAGTAQAIPATNPAGLILLAILTLFWGSLAKHISLISSD